MFPNANRNRSGHGRKALLLASLLAFPGSLPFSFAADHNDPNAVNSIYADVPLSPADLYDIFGYPSADTGNGEAVVVQLTFAPLPATGVFDRNLMYKIHMAGAERLNDYSGDDSLGDMIGYVEGLKRNLLDFRAGEVKVTFDGEGRARLDFTGFPGEDFYQVIDTNEVAVIETPGGHRIKAFVGGRDDAFFNNLPGFFRSINYAPQFYRVPVSEYKKLGELPIPKTLLELEGNELFNFDPANPDQGWGVKDELPAGPYEKAPTQYKKDADGNFLFVYDGRDAQAGFNINTVSLEVPLAFITDAPDDHRVVRTWGESHVRKASSVVPAYAPNALQRLWLGVKGLLFRDDMAFNTRDSDYRQVDHDGVPFSDAALSRRLDSHVGVDNLKYVREFITRFAHLGWGFGPSITTLGLPTCFDHDDSPVPVHREVKFATEAFPRVKDCFLQHLEMPDDSWNPKGLDIPLKRTFQVFLPNLTSIDMDTTGTWPFGRRPEDQVATRFLATFLDMSAMCGAQACDIETLNDPALWDSAPITPGTVPNPRFNDKEFLPDFPYLAEPWPER